MIHDSSHASQNTQSAAATADRRWAPTARSTQQQGVTLSATATLTAALVEGVCSNMPRLRRLQLLGLEAHAKLEAHTIEQGLLEPVQLQA